MCDVPENGRPIEIISFQPVKLDYRTFEDELRSKIFVYYLFDGQEKFGSQGLGLEYRIDLERFIRGMGERIYSFGESQIVYNETQFLEDLTKNKIQAIYTTLSNGMNFLETSKFIAEIHGKKFFEKNSMLKELGVKGLKDLLGLEDINFEDYN